MTAGQLVALIGAIAALVTAVGTLVSHVQLRGKVKSMQPPKSPQ